MKTRIALLLILTGVIAIGLAGCATGPAVTAPGRTMPEMLQEAGFKASPANTPQKMAYLQTCPKDTLMIHTRPGAKVYCFVDPATNSMYMGDEAAYQRLQDLLGKQQQKIEEQRIESDPQFWPLWVDRQGGG